MLCKLTDKYGMTYNETQWGEGITHIASGKGKLCDNGWIHYYDDPLLAVLLNHIHGRFKDPLLWKIEVEGEIKTDHGLKFGAATVTTLQQLPLPEVTTTQRVAFGILCSLEVCKNQEYVKWAKGWLSGEDRSRAAAAAVWATAEAAVWAAAAATAARAADINLKLIAQKAMEYK